MNKYMPTLSQQHLLIKLVFYIDKMRAQCFSKGKKHFRFRNIYSFLAFYHLKASHQENKFQGIRYSDLKKLSFAQEFTKLSFIFLR